MQSQRQKKKRSQVRQKVFERREKKETSSATKKPGKKRHSTKTTATTAKKDDSHSGSNSSSDTDSDLEKYSKRKVESNWQRYEPPEDEELLRRLTLTDHHSNECDHSNDCNHSDECDHSNGSTSEEEVTYYISGGELTGALCTNNATPPDLNILSKSPSELIEFKHVCYDSETERVYYDRQDSGCGQYNGCGQNNNLDQELDSLLDDTRNNPNVYATPIKPLPLVHSNECNDPAPSNTDELDFMLDELLN